MAGFIQIRGNHGLSVSSLAFEAISELTRPYLIDATKENVEAIYRPLDEGALDIISLDEQGEEGVDEFYKASRAAFEECRKLGKCGKLDDRFFDSVMRSWAELLGLIESDPRFRSRRDA